MRELKFKAVFYKGEKKKLSEPFTILEVSQYEGDDDRYVYDKNGTIWLSHLTKFIQWTGLKDKNGKEIYEGDILKDKLGSIVVVTFSNGEFTLLMNTKELTRQVSTKLKEKKFEKESCFRDYEDFKKWFDCEVIGNKFENPELLEEKK